MYTYIYNFYKFVKLLKSFHHIYQVFLFLFFVKYLWFSVFCFFAIRGKIANENLTFIHQYTCIYIASYQILIQGSLSKYIFIYAVY